jgi:hypothetical protein
MTVYAVTEVGVSIFRFDQPVPANTIFEPTIDKKSVKRLRALELSKPPRTAITGAQNGSLPDVAGAAHSVVHRSSECRLTSHGDATGRFGLSPGQRSKPVPDEVRDCIARVHAARNQQMSARFKYL